MNVSTSSSISSVDIPGFTNARRRSIKSESTNPPRRISSISRGDLRTITPSRHRAPDRRLDGVDRPLALDRGQEPPPAVVVEQRRRLLRVHLQAMTDGPFAVVGALDEGGAALVADALASRRVRDDVIRGLTDRTRPASSQPAQQLRIRDVEVDHTVQRLTEVPEQA